MGEQSFLASPFAGPGGRLIASPFQFVADDDTNLRIVSANSSAGVVLAIQGRRIDENGDVASIDETHTPNTDRSTKTQDIKLGRGALLNLTIFASAGAPLIGQTYVKVQFIRGLSGAKRVLGTLLAGLVTSTQALGFPGSPIQSSVEVEPAVRCVLGSTPAAGAEFSETVPTGARWELQALSATLTTSARATDRLPTLRAVNAGTPFLEAVGGADMPPSATWRFSWGPAMNTAALFSVQAASAGTPVGLRLLAAQQLISRTVAIDVADQWSAPSYQIREWLEVP